VTRRAVRTQFRYRRKTIYVDGVPAWTCSRCGEKYFDAEVYRRLEEIARHSRQIRRSISFPLARFTVAIAS
jgi:YgiT-type zinc finger domain-containing protein